MASLVRKHSISSELAQKMVDAAVAKAREIGVSENVAILDDGGNLKAFSRMDGASIPTIEIAQNKAYTALFGVPTQDFFNFIQRDPSLLAGIPTRARVAACGGGLPINMNRAGDGAIRARSRRWGSARSLCCGFVAQRPTGRLNAWRTREASSFAKASLTGACPMIRRKYSGPVSASMSRSASVSRGSSPAAMACWTRSTFMARRGR